MNTLRIKQGGVMILESLIAILLFSIGILALIAMFAGSITMASDAQYRTEAAHYANQLMNEIWVGVNHSADAATLTAQVVAYEFNNSGSNCAFGGGGGTAVVTEWVNKITGDGGLPGATTNNIQVDVDPLASNQVTITICWSAPSDKGNFHSHVLVGNVS